MQQNRRILIVDDQQDLREQLAKLLLRSGKTNETTSLVQGIRARLGQKDASPSPAPKGLSDQEYEVDTAGQGEEAFEMVKKAQEEGNPYAIMFTDMRMPPGWDGLETSKRVREIDRNIEIVIMTAFADHDQKLVAETVGTPHKLLYIKKPFQSEEIFQLALSLTAKWSFEETERQRKDWLETLLRCMSKVKSANPGSIGDIYATVLKSLLTFTTAEKGFIASLSDTGEWEVNDAQGIERMDVDNFIRQNSDRLRDSRTTQQFDGKYILPLKRENISAVACIYDVETLNDPEWYKLLSLLVMTSSEVLSSAVIAGNAIRRDQLSHLGHAVSKIATIELSAFNSIRSAANKLLGQCGESEALKTIMDTVAQAEKRLSRISDVLVLAESVDTVTSRETVKVAAMIRGGCDLARELSGGFNIELEISGDTEAEISSVAGMLKRVFKNMALNSCEAAMESGRSTARVKAEIKDQKNLITVSFSDDGPGIPAKLKDTFLSPFVSGSENKLGIGLASARIILEKLHGGLYYDPASEGGACFNIKLAKPQA